MEQRRQQEEPAPHTQRDRLGNLNGTNRQTGHSIATTLQSVKAELFTEAEAKALSQQVGHFVTIRPIGTIPVGTTGYSVGISRSWRKVQINGHMQFETLGWTLNIRWRTPGRQMTTLGVTKGLYLQCIRADRESLRSIEQALIQEAGA